MAFPLLPATLLLISAGLAALDYFVPPEVDDPVLPTEPIDPPYSPPFNGGQCSGVVYDVTMSEIRRRRSDPSIVDYNQNFTVRVKGAIGGLTVLQQSPPERFFYRLTLDAESIQFGTRPIEVGGAQSGTIWDVESEILSITRVDGQDDNCGDLPNPNPPFPIASSGLAQSGDPDLLNDSELVSSGLVPINIGALLAAALAALRVATNIAEAVAALADALAAIKEAIDKLFPKERDKNKATYKYDFGSISKDGFLRLYADVSNAGFEAIWLDVLITNIPQGYGKYLGELSPNRYIYDRLGYIAFVSPSLGICEVKEIEFPRQSFAVPKDCIGFFYHLGLNGVTKANVSGIYEQELEPIG